MNTCSRKRFHRVLMALTVFSVLASPLRGATPAEASAAEILKTERLLAETDRLLKPKATVEVLEGLGIARVLQQSAKAYLARGDFDRALQKTRTAAARIQPLLEAHADRQQGEKLLRQASDAVLSAQRFTASRPVRAAHRETLQRLLAQSARAMVSAREAMDKGNSKAAGGKAGEALETARQAVSLLCPPGQIAMEIASLRKRCGRVREIAGADASVKPLAASVIDRANKAMDLLKSERIPEGLDRMLEARCAYAAVVRRRSARRTSSSALAAAKRKMDAASSSIGSGNASHALALLQVAREAYQDGIKAWKAKDYETALAKAHAGQHMVRNALALRKGKAPIRGWERAFEDSIEADAAIRSAIRAIAEDNPDACRSLWNAQKTFALALSALEAGRLGEAALASTEAVRIARDAVRSVDARAAVSRAVDHAKALIARLPRLQGPGRKALRIARRQQRRARAYLRKRRFGPALAASRAVEEEGRMILALRGRELIGPLVSGRIRSGYRFLNAMRRAVGENHSSGLRRAIEEGSASLEAAGDRYLRGDHERALHLVRTARRILDTSLDKVHPPLEVYITLYE